MLIQGSNNPLVIQFDASVADIHTLVVTLWSDAPGRVGKLLKKWKTEDMIVSGNTAICPITETETRAIPPGSLVLEAKGLGENGYTVFWSAYNVDVLSRRDKVITLTGV